MAKNKNKKKKKFEMPNSYVIIMMVTVFVAILSWVLPGGAYNYVDPNASVLQPIPGTFHAVASKPQGIFNIIMAPINGFMQSVDIILYCLVIGGYLALIVKTGALDASIGKVLKKIKGREYLLVPTLMLIFSLAGAAFGIEEETLPFFPVLIPIFILAGYDTLVGLSVIKVGAALGVMGSIANPFAVAIASKFAGISMGDGIGIRLILLAIYIPSGIIFTMRYAKKVKEDPTKSLVYSQKDEIDSFFLKGAEGEGDVLPEFNLKRKIIMGIFVMSFVIMIWGVLPWSELGITIWPTVHWWFGELTGVFLTASILVAIVDGINSNDFIDTFIAGAADLLSVAIIIGVARGVSVLMTNASITDTLLHFCETGVTSMSSGMFAFMNYIIFLILSFFIPSSSGLATLSMSIMAPLADFAHVGREIVVIGYAAASSMIAIIAPTSGLLMGVLAMTKTSFSTWIKFMWKFLLYIFVVTSAVLVLAAMFVH